MKRKICLVTCNRAEYTHCRTLIQELLKNPQIDLRLVAIGSHLLERYGMTVNDIESHGHTVDYRIFMEVEGNSPSTMAKSIGMALCDLATYFENIKPDLVIAPMDRYEITAVAIAAAFMNIPLAHMQGGEVTGTIDESTRHTITKLSHIHFPATEQSRERIIKMGEKPESVFNVGDPGTDLLLQAPQYSYEETVNFLNELTTKKEGVKLNPSTPLILGLQHPVTTEFGSGFKQIQETLHALKRIQDHQIIMLWPNIDAGGDDISRGIRNFIVEHGMENMSIFKHIPYEIYVNLLRHAKCMFGNSSGGIRETCYFGLPTVNIGTRQQDRERGKNVLDAPYDRDMIYRAIIKQINRGRYEQEFLFGDGSSGKRMADILTSIDLDKIEIQKRITY
ncbi:MAG: UDP-N-acetylglucosamine 2-epimerase (hydrolyzing) [Elusimicrobia bacterium]|nr:UDP-N-acetylglucosamine 2-epimerase (hydrolyzing) [Elusimicrobiota bacterium]